MFNHTDITKLLILAAAAIAAVIVLSQIKIHHYPACYFAFQFAGRILFDFSRVRFMIAFQLGVIGFLLLMGMLKQKRDKRPLNNPLHHNLLGILEIMVLLISISVINGLMSGYGKFDILVDVYKYLEIVILYFFLKVCMTTIDGLYRGLVSMAIVMSVLGVIELFTTQRGGVGLNMIMNIAPIMLALGVSGRFKHYIILSFLSLAVVFLSQTRTYIIGFVVALILLFLFMGKKEKRRIFKVVAAAACLAPLVILLTPEKIRLLLERFSLLSDGITAAGGYRIYEIQVAFEKLAQHPLLGSGFGYTEYLFIRDMGYFEWGSFLHSSYVEILLKNGYLVGSGIFLCLIAIVLACVRHFIKLRGSNSIHYVICISGLCSTIGWLLVYAFAPLSSYGSAFIGLSIAVISFNLYNQQAPDTAEASPCPAPTRLSLRPAGMNMEHNQISSCLPRQNNIMKRM